MEKVVTRKKSQETVVDDARMMIIRLDPFRQIDRIGQEIVIKFVRLSYNMVRLTVCADLKGTDERGRPRTITIRERKDFPDWVEKLINRHMPDAFNDPAMVRRAERIAARDRSIRRATPPSSRPDIVLG